VEVRIAGAAVSFHGVAALDVWAVRADTSEAELHHATRGTAALTRQQIQAVIEECADIARDLCHADPADIATGYRRLGLRLTYHPGRKLVQATAVDYPGQRRALFEDSWFAVAAACNGDLEQACAVGQIALQRTATVRSQRSADVLAVLARKLRKHSRDDHVGDFLQQLDPASQRTSQRTS
jgi:hypothetical protein